MSTQPNIQPTNIRVSTRGALSKSLSTIGSVADTIRITADLANIHLRRELVSAKLSIYSDLASEFGITVDEAKRLIEEA